MKKIGITGGIGSGKSTVCAYIEQLGYGVFYSDEKAIWLAENNPTLKMKIIYAFGDESYFPDGSYNRKYIANIVFSDKKQLDIINYLFAPFIMEAFDSFCVDKEIAFYESALILEHKLEDKFDFIIAIFASYDVIVKRLKKRNSFTDEEIENRLNSQLSPFEKICKSKFSIDTSNDQYKAEIEYIIDEILK